MTVLLELSGVAFGYGDKKVLRSVSFSVEKGDFLGVIGPNGAGKTTLFRLITGILHPWSGAVLLGGKDLFSFSRRDRARVIATMPQLTEASFPFTVEEFVAMGRYPHHNRWEGFTARDREQVENALRLTGTAELRQRLFQELSGGERQRALLAQALAQEPELLLLDEPTAHLDIGHQVELLDLVQELNHTKKLTVVTVLHDLNLAAEYCSRLVLLSDGGIYRTGAPADVLTYATIEEVYKTVVVVRENPFSHKPTILPVSKRYLKS